MDHHLADSTQDEVSEGDKPANHRNGYSKKTVPTENEALELSIPRDRRGSFEPQLIAKYQRRFPGFDDKIISMYARGMSVREIQGHLRELYGIEASPQLISTVTDAVLEEVGRWQSRPLDPLYSLVFFDALRVKMRDEGTVRNKAVYLAIGVSPEGRKDVLGIWIEQTEGAKFWLPFATTVAQGTSGHRFCAPGAAYPWVVELLNPAKRHQQSYHQGPFEPSYRRGTVYRA
jgi:putative transposase